MRRKIAIAIAMIMVSGTVATTAMAMTGGADMAGIWYYGSAAAQKNACQC